MERTATVPRWPALTDIESAAVLLRDVVLPTPCLRSDRLSRELRAEVVLKYENMQRTGSFKLRGAHLKLLSLLPGERRRGVIAASSGNHAYGVAFAAGSAQVQSTIVMPHTTPSLRIRSTEGYGSRVVVRGANLAEAELEARRIASGEGLTFVSAFDDPSVIAGAGTVGLEMLRCVPDLDTLVAPIEGGGLISGIALAAKRIDRNIRVIGARVATNRALAGRLNVAIVRELVDVVLPVDQATIEYAVHLLAEREKTVVERTGALAVACLLNHRKQFTGRRVGVVLSG